MDCVKEGLDLFENGGSCSQAVLCAFAAEFGLDEKTAFKLASGFGGGVGCMGGLCGALSGGIMALGLRCGRLDVTDKTGKTEDYRRTKKLCQEFKLRTGSMECRQLLGFDMGTEEGMLSAKKPGAFHECPEYVKIAIELVEEMS